MVFQNPGDGYFIYTKSNCKWCSDVQKLIPKAHIVNSDVYLENSRCEFLNFVDNISGVQPRTFPMVFLNNRFIGGFAETKKYIDDLESFQLAYF